MFSVPPYSSHPSPVQVARGWTQRVRSYVGNIYVGEGNAESGPADLIYKHVRKTTEMVYPNPSDVWVFVEEHPDSINDPAFFSPHQNSRVDLPAPFHSGATAFAMADGHAEMRRWQLSLTAGSAVKVSFSSSFSGIAPAGDPDVRWVANRTPRNSSSPY